nr:putative reverse transcriptase domain-containing protein [Tanacetum cinerariifolium]
MSRKDRLKPRRVRAMSMTIYYGLKTKILEAQSEASKDLKALREMVRGLGAQFERKDDDGLYFMDQISIPSVDNVRTLIMDESHTSKYLVQPSADKIKAEPIKNEEGHLYWWSRMKKDISVYVGKCLTCSKIKAEPIRNH